MTASSDGLLRHIRRLVSGPGPGSASDAALLERFVECRDEGAFAALVKRHAGMVFGVCRRLLGNTADAEDAFQATFLVLARKAASVRPPDALAAYLHGVARRLALKARTARARRRLREVPAPTPDRPAPNRDPLDELSARELLAVLDEELQRLPEVYRLPLLLCCLEGRSQEEAARLLGWTRGSVQGRLERGRARLQARLVRRGVALPAALGAPLLVPASAPAVPAALLAATARLATVPGAVAPAVAALADVALAGVPAGVKLSLAALMLAVGVVIAGAGVVLHRVAEARGPEAKQVAEPKAVPSEAERTKMKGERQRARTDRLGDPLPPGALARLGTVRLQHGFYITSIRYSPDGKLLASAGNDNTVRLWDLATGKERRRFTHEKSTRLFSAAFAPDGKTLTTGDDKVVYVWDLATDRVTHRFSIPQAYFPVFILSPDGRKIAFLSKDGLHLWDWPEGKELRQVKNVSGPIAFSPDGKKIACAGEGIHLLDIATGEDVLLLKKHRASSLAFSPDGKTLATGDYDQAARLWDLATGKERFRLESDGKYGTLVDFSPDGKLLASVGSRDRPIRLWDVATGKEVRRCRGRPDITGYLAFSPDGKTLATAGARGLIQLFDVATGEERLPFDRPPDVGSQVLFLADGKSLLTMNGHTGASQDGGVARVWDAATGKELRHFLCYQHRGHVVASADGGVVAVSTYPADKTVRLRRVSTGEELWQPPGEHSWVAALSADGKRLVTTGHDDHVLHLWDVATGKELQRFEGHRTHVMRIALAPDGKALASASVGVVGGDETLRVWDVATDKERWKWSIRPSRVLTFTFSPDGRLLATVGRAPGLPGNPVVPGEIRLWDVATGKEIRRWEGHRQQAIAAAFSPDGRTLATGGGDHSVRLWEAATGKERRVFRGHDDLVVSVNFSPDGRRLASASNDGTALVWNLTGRIGEGHSRARSLSANELEACWADLAGGDAARAYRGILALAGSPERAVAFLKGRLRPVEAADPRRVDRLLAALDGNDFTEREKAARELEGLGFAAEPALRRALLGKPSLEVRRRVERILEKLEGGLMLRAGRGIEALELTGTTEARHLLQALARGAPEARLTQEAKAALQRLARRPAADR